MGTKESGWSSSLVFRARFLALALSVSSLAVLASAGTAYAVDQKKSRDKIVDFNKQALLSYEAKDFEAAKELLTKALKEAKQAGLDDDKMTARTYLHLGAVYFAGYQDQAVAIQNFTLAKKIRPDIQLTPSIETPEMKAAFDQATVEAEPTSPPPEPEPRPSRPQPVTRTSTPELGGGSEPDLPSSMNGPLMCSTPDEAPPAKELSIRCAVKPGVNAKAVQLHYRALGAEAFQVLPMRRTAKGWYLATIPAHVMKGQSIQVYYDARDARDNEVASNGQIDSPTVIEIRKKGTGGIAGGQESEGDPLEAIKRQQKLERYEAGLHRRREGALWIGLGAGSGWGFAPAGHLEWEKDIQVSAITTAAGFIQTVIDGGYMISDNFSAGLQFRLEYIQQQQAADTSRSGAPTTWAPAFLLRPTYFVDLTSDGNFQASLSAYAGYGYVRLPVKPVKKETTNSNGDIVPDEKNTIAKTDTRPIGPVLFGAGLGLTYHLSRHFSIALDAQLLTGLADFGVAAQAAGQLQIAFGGKAGPAPEGEEEEGEANEAGPGPGNDSPSPDSPATNDSEGE